MHVTGRATPEQLDEYRRLVASVRDYAIFMLDTKGFIRSWNAGAQHLKGYTAEEIIGQHFSTFYTDVDRDRDHPANELKIASREGRYYEEGWRVRKDGTQFWASVTITAVHDDDGKLSGFAKVTRDLTERRMNEEALREAVEDLRGANAELDRFATVAAHDMTDPLRTITGFAEMLERGDLPPEQVTEFAGHIRASSLRLSRMLHGLLTYARAGTSEEPPEAVLLGETIRQTLADLAGPIGDRGARLEVQVPDDAAVCAHGAEVRMVLQNLISNAVKFADSDEPRVEVTARLEDDSWLVSIKDNGPGIRRADRERIFRAFERAHVSGDRAGYGLGLAICRRILDRYDGKIGVESELGEGSVFWFSLPAPR
jgi:PAS domain S-box-containing protein